MKELFKDFGIGISTSFEAFDFIFKNKLAHYYLYPIAMTLLLAYFATKGITHLAEWTRDWVMDKLGFAPEIADGWWDTVLMYIQNFTEMVIEFTLYIVFIYVAHKIMKYVVLILMSPIMALLSEKTEEILTGNEYPFEMAQFLKDIWRGVMIAMRNFFIEMAIIIGVLGFSLVCSWVFPPLAILLGPASTIFLFFIGAYFYGFSTMDYTNERRRLSVRQSVAFIKKNKGIAIGNGSVFAVFLLIPILGTYIGPIFAPIVCSVGATLAIHKKVDLGSDDNYLVPESEKGGGVVKS